MLLTDADGPAQFGPFFAVACHDGPGTAARPDPPWRSMRELVDPSRLSARVHAVRAALGAGGARPPDAVQLRVAASTTHLGLVARLVAPLLAVAVLEDRRLDLRIGELRWQDVLGTPYPLSVPARTLDGPPALAGAPEVITEVMMSCFRVSPRVLWGNVGSAVNTAARLVGDARPELTRRARTVADELLADPRIDGGRLHAGPDFRRRSCCLIHRLAEAPSTVCSDCVLHR